MAADAVDKTAGVVDWLDKVKPGFGVRFSKCLVEIGIEDVGDLADMDGALQAELDVELEKAGAKAVQLKQIRTAVDAIVKAPTTKHQNASVAEDTVAKKQNASVAEDTVAKAPRVRRSQSSSSSSGVIGILQIDYHYTAVEGDVDHPSTFGFQVRYARVRGLTFERAQRGEYDDPLRRAFLAAIRELKEAGPLTGISGNCGFMMWWVPSPASGWLVVWCLSPSLTNTLPLPPPSPESSSSGTRRACGS